MAGPQSRGGGGLYKHAGSQIVAIRRRQDIAGDGNTEDPLAQEKLAGFVDESQAPVRFAGFLDLESH